MLCIMGISYMKRVQNGMEDYNENKTNDICGVGRSHDGYCLQWFAACL